MNRLWFAARRRGEIRVRGRMPSHPVSLDHWLRAVVREALVLAVRASGSPERRAAERTIRRARSLPAAFAAWRRLRMHTNPGFVLVLEPNGMRVLFVRVTPYLTTLLMNGGREATVRIDQTGTLLDVRPPE